MKLALGTAQFGLEYGIANTAGRVNPEAAQKIMSTAWDYGLDTLDTAISYGESESVLGAIGVQSWKIISKLPEVPAGCLDVYGWVEQHIMGSLQRMRVDSLHGLLLHRPGQLLEGSGDGLYEALSRFRSKGLVSKIGISIYSSAELNPLLDRFVFDLVQAPLSILDRSLVESGWASHLKSAGIEVHARSIFLQGLLLLPAHKRPPKFNSWGNVWAEWDRWLEVSRLTPLQACLRYVNALESIDRMVVGVDSLSHLEEVLNFSDEPLTSLPMFEPMQDGRLINPAGWSDL